MKTTTSVRNSRRAFLTKGGAALGAGLASASVAAGALADPASPLRQQLAALQQRMGTLEDRDAIRHLHQTYAALVENQAYDTVVELFSQDACVELYGETYAGKHTGIQHLFTQQYRAQLATAMHTAFQHDQRQQHDHIEIGSDRRSASATFHARVQVSRPLADAGSVSAMAKLQGMTAVTRWENGRFLVSYARDEGQWRISNLQYQTTAAA